MGDKFAFLASLREGIEETPLETQSRKDADFASIENRLGKRFTTSEMGLIDKATSLLGSKNPFGQNAKPKENEVWLLDNTAFRPENANTGALEPWQAEFVACFFHLGRKDLTDDISRIADLIGIDGSIGEANKATRDRIEQRLRPFISAIAPARTIDIDISCPMPSESPHRRTLGPSNANGISSQIVLTGGMESSDGKTVTCTSVDKLFPDLSGQTRFAAPDGWGIISDIDDTIKITQTSTPIGILETTFASVPKTTEGLPEFYKILDDQFQKPAFFYLSASPYNLYPFLHKFINENYPHGTIILRDSSWMYFGGLLQSLTQGVQAYKTDRMRKIHSWLPKRKFICIGDSTQADPESYAQMYREFPGWIKAIYIRKVVDIPHMEAKNKDERFVEAFKDVPDHVWKVFLKPADLADHLKHVAGQAHLGIVGSLQAYFCNLEQNMRKS